MKNLKKEDDIFLARIKNIKKSDADKLVKMLKSEVVQ
jgi:hypothetical protein